MMEMISVRRFLLINLSNLLLLSFIFLVIHLVHFNYFRPIIVLHAVALDSFFSVIATALILFFLRNKGGWLLFFNSALIFLLCTSLYNVLGPTMCDRSLSVFIILKVHEAEKSNQKLSPQELYNIVSKEYVRGNDMTDKRLFEQQASGALIQTKDGLSLTPGGRRTANFFNFIFWSLNMKKNF